MAGIWTEAGDGSAQVALPTQAVRSPGEVAAARRLLPRGGAVSPPLDRLADLAARLLGASSSQLALLTDVRTVVGGAGLRPGVAGDRGGVEDSLYVAAGGRGLVVVRDARTDPRLGRLLPVTSGTVGSYLAVPLVADDGQVVGVMSVSDAAPRDWSEHEVGVLQQLAAAAVSELELSALTDEYEASRARWELAIDAGGIGSFDWDLVTGDLAWDDRLVELFGYDDEREKFDRSIEAFQARVHPDDLPRVMQALEGAIQGCGKYEAEYRVVRPGGDTRWVQARGRVLCDESGRAVRVLGAAYDTTAVRDGEARIARVLESMSAAFYSVDRGWRFTYVNAEAERLLGRRREELLGGVLWELFAEATATDLWLHLHRAVDSGQPVSFDVYYPPPLHGWYEVRAWPGPDGLSVSFLDVTDRRAAQERAALLAEVTAELTGTLEADEALARLARLVVPALADWCVVTLVGHGPDGRPESLRDVGWWHADPDMLPVVERYAGQRMAALEGTAYLARALRASRPIVIRNAGEAATAILPPGEARDLMGRLAPRSVAVLPLRAYGRTLGLVTLAWTERAEPRQEDLATAGEVADRAGLALDNARLYAEQRRLAEGLQRSLLTAPPEPDHMQVVVRYVPASEAAQVGGDWYDAFLQPHGSTMLVIGDVVGHDTEAAAAMGQVRGLLRGIAATTGEGPAQVLTRLDGAMELLLVGTTATAVVARVEQTPDERERGVSRVRWSNAGHPPPIALQASGEVTVLERDADLLLGIDPETPRTESVVTLERDATVLLYTDGLVERRDLPLEEGIARLRGLLAELAGRSLDELCDEVLARMLPARPEDDVALAAVRLHRQDRPRPAEAGPNRVPASLDDPLA